MTDASYWTERYHKARGEFFADKVCVKCGSGAFLELDHIDPTQKVSHKIWSWSKVRREAELAKCQVLCRKCHKDKSCEQRGYKREVSHGTLSGYDHWKCRCGLCKKAKSDRWKEKYAGKYT